jgi:ABC-type uncharacterized transport system involved in gliding motility auxiliary subunit
MELGGGEMKFDMKKMFHDRKFRYGGYSTLITAVVLAILLVVNLVAGKLNVNVDLTKNKLYSLSDQSYKVLEGLKQNVTIYGFYQSGTEDPIVKEILSKYQKGSDKINIVYKDPIKYPQFAAQFDTDGVQVGEGSIVVQSGKKTKVISYTDLMDQSYDQTTGQPTSSSLLVEQKVTGAIMNVTSENNPVVYVLQGHDEAALAPQVSQKLTDSNYTVKDLNLLNEASKLEDGSTLLVVSPQIDLSKDETATLKDFLAKGGKAVFLMDVTREDLPNFNSLLNSYGMSIKRTVAVEGDSNYYYQQPIYLVPNIESQDITLPLITKKLVVVTPVSQAIDILEAKKASLTVEPLLTTSDNSWGKKNLESAVADKEPGDYPGPLNIAVH